MSKAMIRKRMYQQGAVGESELRAGLREAHQHRDDDRQVEAIREADQPKVREPDVTAGEVFPSVVGMMRSWLMSIGKVLYNSDIAFRENRVYQRQMRNDPDIMGPLQRVQMAVALLEWNIVAEDEKDERQVAQAAELTRILKYRTPRFHDALRHLMEARWYGPSAVNWIFGWDGDAAIVRRWLPLHPDSLAFTTTGALGIKVNTWYRGGTTVGPEGRVHIFTPEEREAVTCHTWNPTGADYEDPYDARFVYSGRGLRDVCYHYWMFKVIALQNWMTWIERFALGLRYGTYPSGNAEAKQQVENVLANWVGDASVTIPRVRGKEDADLYSLNLLESNATGAEIFARMIELLGVKLKELIEGQTAMTEAVATGLGSSVAEKHEETFNNIIRFDALSLGETLTRELIWPLHVLNHGPTPWRPRFEFALEKVDEKVFMEAVERAAQLGVEVPIGHVRDKLGIPEPEPDEPTIQVGPPAFDFDGFTEPSVVEFARKIRRAIRDAA